VLFIDNVFEKNGSGIPFPLREIQDAGTNEGKDRACPAMPPLR
jgi:hypothetical protein